MNEIRETLHEFKIRPEPSLPKTVYQYSKDSGKLMGVYASQGNASRLLNIPVKKIQDVIKQRRKSYHGSVFSFTPPMVKAKA